MARRLLFFLLCAAAPAAAALVEEIVQVDVQAKDIHQREHSQPITVTIFRDDERAQAPFLVINHGRAGTSAGRARLGRGHIDIEQLDALNRGTSAGQARLGRARFPAVARYFVTKGFAVFVPTRIGYGVSGGPDVENSGPCNRRSFPEAFEAGAAQTLKVIEYARSRPYVNASKGILVGQSVGGAITIALSARTPEGVLAGINFAGGAGGNPEKRPEDPCSEPMLRGTLAQYGSTATMPTLWLYSENDRYWGKEKPRAWFEAYRAQGASAEFVQLPPYRENGHAIFVERPDAWRSAVEAFLLRVGAP